MSGGKISRGSLASYRELIRSNRNFRFLWLGQIVSLLGDWFNLIASASLVADLTQSGLAVGGLFVVRMLAPFVVSPVAGVVTDRYSRKRLLILADVARAMTVLGFLIVREAQHVWLLYTLTAIQLGLSGFFFPARNAILPDITSDRELGAANALSATTWSVMLAFGAALGGIVAGEWGIYPSFIIDAATFLLSALFIARIVYTPTQDRDRTGETLGDSLREYVDGLRYLRHHANILVTALHKSALSATVFGPFQVIQVALAERKYVIGEGGGTGLGIMYAVMGIGTGLGPILFRYFTGDRHRPLRIAIAVSYAVAALGLLIIAPLISFGVVLVGTFLRGVGGAVVWVFSTQLLLQMVPNHVRGRVFSTEFALNSLMSAVAAGVAGWAIDNPALGISGALWWTGGLTFIPGALWVLWMRLRQPPEERPDTELRTEEITPGHPVEL